MQDENYFSIILMQYENQYQQLHIISFKPIFPNLFCAMPHLCLSKVLMPLCNMYIIFNTQKLNCSLKKLNSPFSNCPH